MHNLRTYVLCALLAGLWILDCLLVYSSCSGAVQTHRLGYIMVGGLGTVW